MIGKRVAQVVVGLWLVGATLSVLYCAGVFGYRHVANFEKATEVTRFEVHDRNGDVLWRVDATGTGKVDAIDYGVVPGGFRQVIPLFGRPRVLTPGERLRIAYTTRTGWTRHDGSAVGTSALKGGSWFAGQLSNTPISEVFRL
jgi:hypothetical protein